MQSREAVRSETEFVGLSRGVGWPTGCFRLATASAWFSATPPIAASRAEAQRDLLVGEDRASHQEHPVDRSFAIASQTFGQSDVDAAARRAFEARLVALG